MTVYRFVEDTIAVVAGLSDGSGAFPSYALGTLAGAAMMGNCVFSSELVDAAMRCCSMEDLREIERRSYFERLTPDAEGEPDRAENDGNRKSDRLKNVTSMRPRGLGEPRVR